MITRACLLTVAATLAVAPLPAGEPPAGALATIRDMRLTMLARRDLQSDKLLKPYNLGVEVKAGVARVWGTLPNRDLARRAVSRLEHLDGVRDVVSDLKTAGPVVIADAGFKALKGPATPPPPAAPAVPVKRDGLAERVRAAQQERFAGVRVEVSGRVVTVFRGADDEAAGALALRLRDVEGVEEVRLER